MASRDETPPPGPPVVVILGQTGSGKTKLGIELARHVGGEVVNVDSMQVYAGLPIATAQVPEEERQGVPHHLLGVVDPREGDFTVQRFRDLALPVRASRQYTQSIPLQSRPCAIASSAANELTVK